MIGIGPFSIRVVAVAGAVCLAWLVARFLPARHERGQRQKAASLVLDAFMVGLVAARVAYVLRWWPEYIATPLSMVAIADGGFYWWAGLPAALAFVAWRTRHLRALRVPVASSIAVGMVAWGLVLGGVALMHRSMPPLPQLTLNQPDGAPVALAHYAGQPLVVNLWATWCPPCRREMPALERAEREHPQITFLMINQGEAMPKIAPFLQRANLQFRHVLLDYGSQTLHAVGSNGLPTTLFFDAEGQLVASHVGEISAARLRDTIQSHFGAAMAGHQRLRVN